MSKGVGLRAGLLAGCVLLGCARNIPPPCIGEQCRNWPHLDLRFWSNHVAPQGRPYTGALCVQVAYDCPGEGHHNVWIEPQASRCRTYLNTEGPEWLRVERGRLSIPWPARCQTDRVEVWVTAQPNFARCSAVNNQMVVATRQGLTADITFECR